MHQFNIKQQTKEPRNWKHKQLLIIKWKLCAFTRSKTKKFNFSRAFSDNGSKFTIAGLYVGIKIPLKNVFESGTKIRSQSKLFDSN